MENTFLPGTVRERIADLMKYHKVSQTALALKNRLRRQLTQPVSDRKDGQARRREYHPYCQSF